MTTIIPDPDKFQETLKLLLELSGRPREVRIVSVQAISVPDDVAERYIDFQRVDDREETVSDGDQEEVVDAPKKRGPGRPRKVPIPEGEQ